jgi:hypothetical protein
MSRAFAMGQLRHLYAQMVGGDVTNTSRAATGLLGPAIAALELADKAAAPRDMFEESMRDPAVAAAFWAEHAKTVDALAADARAEALREVADFIVSRYRRDFSVPWREHLADAVRALASAPSPDPTNAATKE